MDDLCLTGKTLKDILWKTSVADNISDHANMWVYSGDNTGSVEIGECSSTLSIEDNGVEIMLEIIWELLEDAFRFQVRSNLSDLKRKHAWDRISARNNCSQILWQRP